jgi:hypothetical protein
VLGRFVTHAYEEPLGWRSHERDLLVSQIEPAARTKLVILKIPARGGCLQRSFSAKSEYEQLHAAHAMLLDDKTHIRQYRPPNTKSAAVA